MIPLTRWFEESTFGSLELVKRSMILRFLQLRIPGMTVVQNLQLHADSGGPSCAGSESQCHYSHLSGEESRTQIHNLNTAFRSENFPATNQNTIFDLVVCSSQPVRSFPLNRATFQHNARLRDRQVKWRPRMGKRYSISIPLIMLLMPRQVSVLEVQLQACVKDRQHSNLADIQFSGTHSPVACCRNLRASLSHRAARREISQQHSPAAQSL